MRTVEPLLSGRMKHILAMVTAGNTGAEVGFDQGYMSIYLIQSGRTERVIAMDVGSGPLKRAEEHIREFGLTGRIETRLSDGLQALREGEADCAVCAGMGGKLVCGILERGLASAEKMKSLVLQPQSELHIVRAWLREHGFFIDAEDMVLESGKFYPMMRVVPAQGVDMTPENGASGASGNGNPAAPEDGTLLRRVQDRYGPCLLRSGHPVLRQYLKKERRTCGEIMCSLKQASGAGALRREELMWRLREIDFAQSYMEGAYEV